MNGSFDTLSSLGTELTTEKLEEVDGGILIAIAVGIVIGIGIGIGIGEYLASS